MSTVHRPTTKTARFETMQQCADRLGVTSRTVRNYIARGFFPAYRIPGARGVRLRPEEVDSALSVIPAARARTGVGSFGPNAKIVTIASARGEQ